MSVFTALLPALCDSFTPNAGHGRQTERETMLETADESIRPTGAQSLATSARGGRKIRDRWPEPPSGRADTNVRRMHLPLAALKWVAVVFGVLGMLVVAPLLDLVGSAFSSLRRVLWAAAGPRRR